MGVYKLVCYDFKMNIFYKGELNKLSRPTSFVHYLFFETKQMSCGNSWPRGVVVERQTIIILLSDFSMLKARAFHGFQHCKKNSLSTCLNY